MSKEAFDAIKNNIVKKVQFFQTAVVAAIMEQKKK